MDTMDTLQAELGLTPDDVDMMNTLHSAMRTIWDDAAPGDAVVVHEYLIEHLPTDAVTAFRKRVLAKRKQTYMRDYMRDRRKELLREKQEKSTNEGTAFAKAAP